MTETCKELIWVKALLKDMSIDITEIYVYEDNQSTLKLLDHEGVKTRSKHIDVRYHFVRDLKLKKEMIFKYCETNNMIADLLTKPLSGEKIKKFKLLIGLGIFQN